MSEAVKFNNFVNEPIEVEEKETITNVVTKVISSTATTETRTFEPTYDSSNFGISETKVMFS